MKTDGEFMSNDTFAAAWNHKPDYPWVYRIQPGNAYAAAFGVVLFGLGAIGFARETPSAWLALSAMASLASAYVCWYAKIGQLVVTEDRIEIRRPFFSRTIMRSEIKGRRSGGSGDHPSGYIRLVTATGSSWTLQRHGWFKLDRHFMDWVNSLPHA